MKACGFRAVACGPDGPGAEAIATAQNQHWAAYKKARPRSARQSEFPVGHRKKGYVYFLRLSNDLVKIGFTTNPVARLKDLQTGIGAPIDTWIVVEGTIGAERRLHRLLRTHRTQGEWFKATGPVLRQMRDAVTIGVVEDNPHRERKADDLFGMLRTDAAQQVGKDSLSL